MGISRVLMARRDVAACLFFVIFWIIPLCYTGITNRDVPFLPRTVTYLQRIAFLFTHAMPAWPVYYIEGRTSKGSDWFLLNEGDYFKLKPFGYRSRLHQFMIYPHYAIGYGAGTRRQSGREAELARWIAKRYAKRYPDRPQLIEIRFLRVMVLPNDEWIAWGRWRPPDLSNFPEDQIQAVSVHDVGPSVR